MDATHWTLTVLVVSALIALAVLLIAVSAFRTRIDILCALNGGQELYGLALVSMGVGRRGTIYIHLTALEERLLIVSRVDHTEDVDNRQASVLPRRLYRRVLPIELPILIEKRKAEARGALQ